MPMPKPKTNEAQNEFIERAHGALAQEFPDQKQRHAVIMAEWRKARKCRKADGSLNRKTVLSQLALGTKEEMEHTDNPLEAMKIAVDHLLEDQDYYTKLKAAGLVDKAVIQEKNTQIPATCIEKRIALITARINDYLRKDNVNKCKSPAKGGNAPLREKKRNGEGMARGKTDR